MYCIQCGTQNDDTSRVCRICSTALPAAVSQPTQAPLVNNQYTGNPNVPNHLVPAILVTLFCCLPFGIVSIVYAAQVNSKLAVGDVQGAIADSGRAKTWAIVSLALGFIPMIMIFAAIVIPNLLRSRIAANEASAVGSVRTINTAEVTYSSAYPGGYACRLENLGGSAADCGSNANPAAQHACLVDNVLSSGQKFGYRFSLLNCDSQSYELIAEPMTPGSSGVRTFCSDETGVIRYLSSGTGEQCLQRGTTLR